MGFWLGLGLSAENRWWILGYAQGLTLIYLTSRIVLHFPLFSHLNKQKGFIFMLKKTQLIVAVAAMSIGSVALANGYDYGEAAFQPGFYIGGQAGYGDTHYKAGDALSTGSTGVVNDTKGFAGRGYAGYEFTQNFGIEVGFAGWRDAKISKINGGTTSLKISQWAGDVMLKFMVPLGNNFGVYVKGGGAYVKTNRDYSATIAGSIADQHKVRPTAAIGASYAFDRHVSADIGWQRYFSGSNVNNADLFTIGLMFKLA